MKKYNNEEELERRIGTLQAEIRQNLPDSLKERKSL